MKKKIVVLALCILMISGCGSKIPTLSNGDEAVVTLKDGEMISANELYNQLKEDYALEALINMVDKKILEEKYADYVTEAEKDTESTMSQLESMYGDELQQMIQQYTGYQTVDAYKNAYYLSKLKENAVNDYCKNQIEEKDIKKYYESEIVGDIKVSHILITPKVTDEMTDEEKKAAEDEAMNKAKSILNELKAVKKDALADKFAELAKANSEDEASKENNGSLGFINKGTLSKAYDELVTEAYKLKDGELSGKVVTTELGYHVILRTETKEKASLDEVKDTILDTLAQEYLEKNPVANVRAMQEIRKDYDLEIVDSSLQEKYAKYIQNMISYYENSDAE